MPDAPNPNAGTEGGAAPAGTPNPAATGGGSQTDKTGLLGGRFKNAEELATAYAAMEKQRTVDQQNYQANQRRLAEIEATVQGREDDDAGTEQALSREEILSQLANDPAALVSRIAEQVAAKKIQEAVGPLEQNVTNLQVLRSIREAQAKYSDFNNYLDKMTALSEATDIKNPEVLYVLAKYPDMQKSITESEAAHKKALEEARAQAYADGGMGPTTQRTSEEEDFVKSIVSAGPYKPGQGKRPAFI